jgi:SnoaL-like domain
MRCTALLACLTAAACSHATLPGTNIRDTPQNRAVLDVFGRYKQALEARDARAILALTTPDYSDAGDPARGIGPIDHQVLEQRLKGDLSKVTGVRFEATVKDVEVKGEQARLDYFQVLRYAVATPSGEKWKSESDDARMRFVRINGEWKIASGL